MERILQAMGCSEVQQVILGAYILREDADYWWKNTSQRLAMINVIHIHGNKNNDLMKSYTLAFYQF
jgi:predicted phosphohydrolase